MKRVYSGIGGQAVIEGIMMKNKTEYATAVRLGSGEIKVQKEEYVSLTERYPILALPLLRGVFSFADSMILGMRTLEWSASFFEEETDEEPGKFEQWLEKTFGDRLEKVVMGCSMVLAVVLAVVLFMVTPTLLSSALKKVTDNYYVIALAEGLLRLGIFIAYIAAVSRMEDIRRTFMYHGAEHKCINCVELGLPLTVENVMKSSKEHKRCGTSFLIIVMMISILFFMFIRVEGIGMRILSRILLVPVIAGVSYEFLRIAGRSESPIVNLLSKPGMWMQGLTTKEPTPDMCEVAIAATEAVFDWKGFLEENFGWEPEQTESGKGPEA